MQVEDGYTVKFRDSYREDVLMYYDLQETQHGAVLQHT